MCFVCDVSPPVCCPRPIFLYISLQESAARAARQTAALAADELRAERRALDARAKECDRMAAEYEQRVGALAEREREAKAERAAADEWRREAERAAEAQRAQSAAFDAGMRVCVFDISNLRMSDDVQPALSVSLF
jgi:hypothetical protein